MINVSLKSTGQTVLPMVTSFVALASNVLFNYLFIFVFDRGVEGAAIATVIARLIEVSLQIVLINVLKMPVAGKLKNYIAANGEFIKKYIKLVIPVILNELMWALGTSMYNAAYKFCGTEAQGALQISNSVNQLFSVIGMGVGSACGIMLANTLGEGDIERAVRYSRKFMPLSMLISLVMGACLIAGFPLVISVFEVSGAVHLYAFRIMLVLAAMMIFRSFNFTAIVGILRSGGDTMFCFILDMGSVWLIGVPLAFIGAALLKLPIYWVVAMVSMEETFKFFLSGKRVIGLKWARKLV
jgi:putative MATE family efflux protein